MGCIAKLVQWVVCTWTNVCKIGNKMLSIWLSISCRSFCHAESTKQSSGLIQRRWGTTGNRRAQSTTQLKHFSLWRHSELCKAKLQLARYWRFWCQLAKHNAAKQNCSAQDIGASLAKHNAAMQKLQRASHWCQLLSTMPQSLKKIRASAADTRAMIPWLHISGWANVVNLEDHLDELGGELDLAALAV